MRVLFVFFTDPPRPFSSSVAALSAVVRNAGHDPLALEVHRRSRIDDVARKVASIGADVIAVSAMTRDWPGARALLERAVHTQRPYAVVGGYHASLAPHDVAACHAVDAICIGEGERPMAGLLDSLARGEVPASRPGLWARGTTGFPDAVPSADPETDIASLPCWDYEVFGEVSDIVARGVNTFGPHVDRFLPTRASRGCPFTCAYCSAPSWGALGGLSSPSMRNVRPVDHVCEEHSALRDRHGPEGFEFWDEHFPIDVEWLRELARDYPRRVGLPFKVEMHPNAATRERLELLVEAGCVLFHCGVEAGDEGLRRKVLNRRTRDDRLERLFDDARELGLETSASLMTSLPRETAQQALSTVHLVRRLRPGSLMWSNYQALPGTVLGDAAVEKWPGASRERFDDYAEEQSRTPTLASAAERNETFRQLTELQGELVAAASARASRPKRARPVDVPPAMQDPPNALARVLGLARPSDDRPLSRARLNRASFHAGSLLIEIEPPGAPPRHIEIRRLDDAPRYCATDKLALSYRGSEASTALLREMDALADRLGNIGIDELERAARHDVD